MTAALALELMAETRRAVIEDVLVERARQDAKWGEQNHLDGTDLAFATCRDLARDRVDALAQRGRVTWVDILDEELLEAYSETDPELLRGELVQVAAVVAAWIEAIDRRRRAAAAQNGGGVGTPGRGATTPDVVLDPVEPASPLPTPMEPCS